MKSKLLGATLFAILAACGSDDTAPNVVVDDDSGRGGRGDDTDGTDVGVDVPATDVGGTDTGAADTSEGPRCGDGNVDEGETCDDGNNVDDDACTNTCTLPGDLGVCEACTEDADCAGSADRCIDINGEMMCALSCETERCPPGYECSGPIIRDGQLLDDQCVPLSGICGVCDDADDDGVCDWDDACEGEDDTEDRDNDGIPDACDECPDDNPNDSDGDTVCDSVDACDGGDDRADADEDGTPNACDECPFAETDDSDEDGICDDEDRCVGHDDAVDVDMDGTPDGCDDQVEICDDGESNDGDELIDCADDDCARHWVCGPCSDAREVTVDTTVSGSTSGLTDDFESLDCAFSGAPEAIHVFTPVSSGTYCMTTAGSRFDTVLYGRPSCAPDASETFCDDDGADEFEYGTSEEEVELTAGEPIFVFVDGFEDGEDGAYNLGIYEGACGVAFQRAACDSATPITAGTTSGDLGEDDIGFSSSCAFSPFSGEVIYAFTSEETGTVCVETESLSDDTDTLLSVRTDCLDAETELGCNDNRFDAVSSVMEFEAEEGETYTIIVDGFSRSSLDYDLTISYGGCD